MQTQQKLTFEDGPSFNDCRASESAYGLYLFFGGGQTMHEVVSVLNDPEKTNVITYEYNSATLVFEGFTEIYAINKTGNSITAIMQKVGDE